MIPSALLTAVRSLYLDWKRRVALFLQPQQRKSSHGEMILTPPTEELLPHRDANDPTSVQRFRWLRAGNPYVDFYAVHGGGHAVPQPYFRFPRLLGHTTADIDG